MSYYHKDIFDTEHIWIAGYYYQVNPKGILSFNEYSAKEYQDFLRSIGSLEEKLDRDMVIKIDEATRKGCNFTHRLI